MEIQFSSFVNHIYVLAILVTTQSPIKLSVLGYIKF